MSNKKSIDFDYDHMKALEILKDMQAQKQKNIQNYNNCVYKQPKQYNPNYLGSKQTYTATSKITYYNTCFYCGDIIDLEKKDEIEYFIGCLDKNTDMGEVIAHFHKKCFEMIAGKTYMKK